MPPTVACFDGVAPHPPRVRPPLRRAERARRRGARSGSEGAARAALARPHDRERRPDARRPRGRARRGGGVPAEPRDAPARDPGEPRHPAVLAGAVHAPVAGLRASLDDDGAGVVERGAACRRRELGAAVRLPARPRAGRRPGAGRGEAARGEAGGAARRRRPPPAGPGAVAAAEAAARGAGRTLERLAAAGAELIVSGHTHQAAVAERRDFEVLADGARPCVLATAPGLG